MVTETQQGEVHNWVEHDMEIPTQPLLGHRGRKHVKKADLDEALTAMEAR